MQLKIQYFVPCESATMIDFNMTARNVFGLVEETQEPSKMSALLGFFTPSQDVLAMGLVVGSPNASDAPIPDNAGTVTLLAGRDAQPRSIAIPLYLPSLRAGTYAAVLMAGLSREAPMVEVARTYFLVVKRSGQQMPSPDD